MRDITCKILILGTDHERVRSLRTILGGLGSNEVECSPCVASGLEILTQTRFDIVFLELDANKTDITRLVNAIRRDPLSLNPMVPLFPVFRSPSRDLVELTRDLGINDVLTWPISAAVIGKKMAAALTSPSPFVLGTKFFGPDRRRARDKRHTADERRRKKARLVRITVEEEELGTPEFNIVDVSLRPNT